MFLTKYTPEQRRLVHSLKAKGMTGMDVADLCAGPSDEHRDGLERFEITKDTVNRIHREETEAIRSLTASPLAEDPDATDKLRKAIITFAEESLDQLRRKRRAGKFVGIGKELNELAAVVVKLKRLDGPGKSSPNGEATEQPKGFLDTLAEQA